MTSLHCSPGQRKLQLSSEVHEIHTKLLPLARYVLQQTYLEFGSHKTMQTKALGEPISSEETKQKLDDYVVKRGLQSKVQVRSSVQHGFNIDRWIDG